MGFQRVDLSFSIKKDVLINLLLLNKPAELTAINGEKFVLGNISEHKKFGLPGVEDGANHFFRGYIEYKQRFVEIRSGCFQSTDGGLTYEGSLSFDLYPNDNFNE